MPDQFLTAPVISKLPLGMLSFFGIKNGGKYPQSIDQVISPSLELLEWLTCNYHENVVIGTTVTAVGFTQGVFVVPNTPAVVPAGEIWYMQSASAVYFTGAGDAVAGTIVMRAPQSGSANAMTRSLTDLITVAAARQESRPAAIEATGTRWFYPGDIFGAYVTTITNATGTINLALHCQLTRFQI